MISLRYWLNSSEEYDDIFLYGYAHWEPKVWVCLKCMKYKTDLNRYKNKLKKIYTKYYEKNMSVYINKNKKVKLTVDGLQEGKSTADLDSLNVLLKSIKLF